MTDSGTACIFLRNCLDSGNACPYTGNSGQEWTWQAFLARARNVIEEKVNGKKGEEGSEEGPEESDDEVNRPVTNSRIGRFDPVEAPFVFLAGKGRPARALP